MAASPREADLGPADGGSEIPMRCTSLSTMATATMQPQCSQPDFNKGIYSYFHCICSAQQAPSLHLKGSTTGAVGRWITPPVTLVPRRVDLKRGHSHGVLIPDLVGTRHQSPCERTVPAYLRLRIPRLTSTLARSNTLAGNGLRPPGLTCWIQSNVSGLASAETGPMMAASSRACARRVCTAGQYARCGRHADATSSSFPRPRPRRWPAIGPASDADPKQRRSLRRGEGHERQSTAQCG